MNENWAIAIIGAALTVMTLIMGWMASSIAGMRNDLKAFVVKDDCNRAMDGHCDEIRNLWGEIRKNSERIAELDGIIKKVNNS